MASNQRATLYEHRNLHYLLSPFKLVYVYVLALLLVVVIAFTSLYAFTEIKNLGEILKATMANTLEQQGNVFKYADWIYKHLNALLFDATNIREALNVRDKGSSYQRFWVEHINVLQKLDWSAKVISMRMATVADGMIVFYIPLLILAAFDGFTMRSIRRACIGRESSSLYHRFKYWARAVLIMGIGLYICSPYYMPAWFFIVVCIGSAVLSALVFRFYKKYW
ncbi:DUF4400 domain-containing protein [Hydromonas duriensis]|uniref:Uncharacterized protein DUF4400 n=1 Tax=Hydromonas duriensis TaxID=1527608 RepID=A0A4R6Y6F4_9BURK|nr:DUF4400 domain-containing protein [Hydromonas duriensis]TDR30494.1 uncharacterized protein DUF4400 [Hydromonas duriensis]